LRDDAALITPPPGKQLVITKDAIAQGVHYVGDELPDLIARKLLRVNLSDLAAKGAEPYGYLLGVALPKGIDADAFLAAFTAGLREDQERFGIALLGGDSIAVNGPAVFSLTALGWVDAGAMLQRSTAGPGDHVYVSGTVGDAYLGLQVARHGPSLREQTIGPSSAGSPYNFAMRNSGDDATRNLLTRYQLPEPRLALGRKLIGIASACMDISDGLAQDMAQLCRASGAGATLQAAQIPLSDAARAAGTPLAQLLTGGDDYELLFTVPPQRVPLLAALKEPVTPIGVMTDASDVTVLDETGAPLRFSHSGYSHF
jgi:thiamine-monophosphate kinase